MPESDSPRLIPEGIDTFSIEDPPLLLNAFGVDAYIHEIVGRIVNMEMGLGQWSLATDDEAVISLHVYHMIMQLTAIVINTRPLTIAFPTTTHRLVDRYVPLRHNRARIGDALSTYTFQVLKYVSRKLRWYKWCYHFLKELASTFVRGIEQRTSELAPVMDGDVFVRAYLLITCFFREALEPIFALTPGRTRYCFTLRGKSRPTFNCIPFSLHTE